MKIRWYDWLIYRLYFWRWGKILRSRPDMRELIIANLKAFDVLDEGDPITVTVTIERRDKDAQVAQ